MQISTIVPSNKIIFEAMIAKVSHDMNNNLLMIFIWNLNHLEICVLICYIFSPKRSVSQTLIIRLYPFPIKLQ